MKKVHLVLQAKGGVGKSLVSSLLIQYLKDKNCNVIAMDTDPSNTTLSKYKSLNVEEISILNDDETIDTKNFDAILERIAESPDETHFVIDTGSSNFIELMRYIIDNEILSIWKNIGGAQTIIHTIITAGQTCQDTLDGFSNLMNRFGKNAICVWKNNYFGRLDKDVTNEEFKEIINNINKMKFSNVKGIVDIPLRNMDTFGYAMKKMLENYQTFNEGLNDESKSLMERQRLVMIWKNISENIQNNDTLLIDCNDEDDPTPEECAQALS